MGENMLEIFRIGTWRGWRQCWLLQVAREWYILLTQGLVQAYCSGTADVPLSAVLVVVIPSFLFSYVQENMRER